MHKQVGLINQAPTKESGTYIQSRAW